MNLTKNLGSRTLTLFAAIALLIGCTFTTTKTKNPNYVVSTAVVDSIKALVDCEHINIEGVVQTVNKDTSSKLIIKILNGKNIPLDQENLSTLSKSIAKKLKQSLADPKEYDKYQVIFVAEKTSGLATSTSSSAYTYESSKL